MTRLSIVILTMAIGAGSASASAAGEHTLSLAVARKAITRAELRHRPKEKFIVVAPCGRLSAHRIDCTFNARNQTAAIEGTIVCTGQATATFRSPTSSAVRVRFAEVSCVALI